MTKTTPTASDLSSAGFVSWPDDRPAHYNGSGEPCDMFVGPCSCGATHTLEQWSRPVTEAPPAARVTESTNNHGLDTDKCVYFYEQDFYILSNFSAFTLYWKGQRFDTSEAAYHWEKFQPRGDLYDGDRARVATSIRLARSAHEAFQIAQGASRAFGRPDWEAVKVSIMREILRTKVEQHPYVRRKLLATGDRELIENSWRDTFWGWGPEHTGQNMLGKLWMEIRAELRAGETAQ